ncbi:MAG TPA: homoserine dehydrogenase [Acidimicrobiales bacterium]|nr:homoserine dehydrogenase [Acidimicrobiales bacterium]
MRVTDDAAPAVRVALLGCGTVGAEVARALSDPGTAGALADAAGARLELVGVAVARDGVARRGVAERLVTTDGARLLADTHPDVVVELIGGTGAVRDLVNAAIDGGASVVTANKALLATELRALTERAASRGVDLYYEAAVAGAIPIVRVLRTSLAGQRLERVLGIVNGTTNFLLTTMARDGRELGDVLEEATARGFAERDPSADLDGHDAAQKAALLATLAFGTEVTDRDVPRVGIAKVTLADLEAAARMGHVVRLLAVAERVGDDAVSVRVHPAMVPTAHPLAAVDGASNAIFVEGDDLGPLMLEGRGAGGPSTASAVLGDLVVAARNRVRGVVDRPPTIAAASRLVAPGDVRSAFYLAIKVADRPGVLAAVATTFGSHGVSIRIMEQVGLGEDARLVFVTHHAAQSELDATIGELGDLDAVTEVGAVLHVVERTEP